MKNGKLTIGSYFTGIKGIDLGFERAGFKVKWYVENNKFCQDIIRKHDNKAVIYEDAEKIDPGLLERVNGIVGGFPCQDISNAGNMAGIEGERSSLWRYMFKAISKIRPNFAFIENVSALTQRGLSRVLCDFASIRYDAEWHCIPASIIGLPHQRDRLFLIAYPHQIRCNNSKNMGKILGDQEIKEWASKEIPQWNRWGILRSIKNNKILMQQAGKSLGIKPLISGNDDGFSREMDRVGALGNAVVPQISQLFAIAIKNKLCV